MIQYFTDIDVMHFKKNIRHLFSIDDLSPNDIDSIIAETATLQKSASANSAMVGRLAGLCFFQQSTRTRVGFDAAMKRLGGETLSVAESRGVERTYMEETIEDTIRVVSAYCDVIVMRHKDTQTMRAAMEVSVAPIVNAGSGREHHPTQTLIDLFHIKKHFGRLSGLRIGIVGDLSSSRTARSLVRAMRHWPPSELRLMSPAGRKLEDVHFAEITGSKILHYDHMIPDHLDVLYVAGLPNPEDAPAFSAKTRENLTVNTDTCHALPDHGIVMCPLPRLDEINRIVDRLPQATYFQQSDDGIWVRMAVLQWIESENKKRVK